MKKQIIQFLLYGFLFAASISPTFAQSQAIEGVVLDQAGAALGNTAIAATNIETGATRNTVTDLNGLYRFPLLPLGTYRITAKAGGFKRMVHEGITLVTGQTKTVDLNLEPGELEESVTVSADTSVADTGKTDLGRVLNNRETQNLPLLARNPYHLGRLQANVNGRWNRGVSGFTLFNANGYLRRVNYQIDGNTNTFGTNRFLIISDTFVNEVQLITNGFAAEFGNTPGMILNVITPAGSNKLDGALAYRFRRPPFYTRPFFYPLEGLAESRADDITFAIGGPVKKDRWHFYFGYEDIRQQDNSSADRLVTIRPEDRDRLIAEGGLSPSIFPAIFPSSDRSSFYIVRSDLQLNNNNRIVVRFNHADTEVMNFFRAGLNTLERGTNIFPKDGGIAFQLVSYTSRLLNEFRFQYAQTHGSGPTLRNELSGTGPTITITGVANFGSPIGLNTIPPTNRIIQFQDNLTRTSGEHASKFGGGFSNYRGTERSSIFASYTFPSIDAFIAARNGTNRYGYSRYEETFGDPNAPYSATFWNLFAQDDWRVTHRLKINFGLRYDLYRIPKADPTSPLPASRSFNLDKNNFAPRLGIAYTLRKGDRPTILRAGAGIYYDAPLLQMYRRAIQNNGKPRLLTVSFTPTVPNAPAFPNTFLGILPPGSVLPPPDIDALGPDFENMYAIHSNIQLEQAITEDLSFALGYVHSAGRHIPVYRSINCKPTGGSLADGRPLFGPPTLPITPCTDRLFPQFQNIQMVEAAGVSRYDALTLQLTQRLWCGLQFSAHYTLSNATDDAPEQNLANAPGPGGFILSDPTDRSRDKGRSFADQRHTFIMSLVARPQISATNRTLRYLLNNNQVSMVAAANSGEAFNIFSGLDLNRDGIATSDRPVGIKRNSRTTPPLFNVDFRYSRFLDVIDSYRIEVFCEFQNLFNTNSIVAFNNVSVPTNPTTGELIGPLPDFRARNQSTSQDSRQVQIGLKFIF